MGGSLAAPMEVFNCGPGRGGSVRELIDTVQSATGVEVPHRIASRRAVDIAKAWADPTKANDVIGWHATVPLGATLLNAWKWQLALRQRGIQ